MSLRFIKSSLSSTKLCTVSSTPAMLSLNDSPSPPPRNLSLPSLLSLCTSLLSLQQTHSVIVRSGSEQDHYIITRFISLLSQISLPYAVSVFHRVSSPNIYLWNTMLNTHVCFSSPLSKTLSVFSRMRMSGVGPDKCTFPALVKSCSKRFAGVEGETVHGLVFKYGTEGDVFVGSSLVDFYGKCGRILCARRVFDEMSVKNEVSWTSLVVGFVVVGDLGNAMKVFDEMPERNVVSWNAMINGFVRGGDVASARRMFDEMPKKNLVSFTVMIDGYAKAGDMASARFLFEGLGKKDIVSWSALISGYAQNNQPYEAVKVFTEMEVKRVKPDEYVLVSLMCACSQIGSLEMARWVDGYLGVNGFDIHKPYVLAALIHMNAKCGNMDRATDLFEGMPKRDLITFCSMIQGLSVHGCADKAVGFFNRMLSEGLVPDNVAFTVILTACSRGGLLEEGCRIFTSMIKDYSVVLTSHHYACMVDLFGRAGKLKAAYELLKLMPVEPHVSVWGALLGACKLHCDVELGEEIASRLFEIEPLNAGNYVAMSDIYAQLDRWLDVSLVRQKMSERGIRKLRGCSWI